jgi:hypothetical protein
VTAWYCIGWGWGIFVIGVAIGILASCTPSTPAASIYQSLVDAGCLAPAADGVQAIADEHAASNHPTWIDCMWAGGTVIGCQVPCK